MTAFPLPPGYRLQWHRKMWVCLDSSGRRFSHSYHDTRDWRIWLWERWIGWA